MAWFLYLISIIWLILGTVFVLYTDRSREFLKGLLKKRGFRVLGPLPLGFGILLMISASWSEVFWLIFLLGLIAAAKGLYLLFGPRNQVEMLITWWCEEASDQLYRLCGLICLVLGITLLSWIQ